MAKLRVGVLASGRGTNLQAIIDAIERGEVEAEIVLVVSNRPGALALQRAICHNISSVVIREGDYPSRRDHQMAIAEALRRKEVGLVVLAGFDKILVPEFVGEFPHRVINIHPSLLPAFAGGLHAQAEALRHGVKLAGCTVHFCTAEVDAGPIILQAAVPVLDDDTEESLSARILGQEHRILPQAIQLIAKGAVKVIGRKVYVTRRQGGK